MNTLNAPLEPYVSPLTSPKSPEHGIKYQYSNPLKLFKGEGLDLSKLPAESDGSEIHTNDMTNTNTGPKTFGTCWSGSIQSPQEEIFKPSVVSKAYSSSNSAPIDPSVHVRFGSSPDARICPDSKLSDTSLHTFKNRNYDSDTPVDSGVTFSSPVSHSSCLPYSDTSLADSDIMEFSIEVPQTYSMSPKRAHSKDSESKEQPLVKSLRSSGDKDSNEIGSVKSGSSEDIKSSFDKITDFNTVTEVPNTQVSGSQKAEGESLPGDIVALKLRKLEALSPYKPRSKYMASKLGHVQDGNNDDSNKPRYDTLANDFNQASGSGNAQDLKAKDDRAPTTKGPVKGEHTFRAEPIKMQSRNAEPLFTMERGSRPSYKPRSPSPLTLPPTPSRSHHDLSLRSRSTDKESPKTKSMERLKGGYRSLSPRKADNTYTSPNDDKDQRSSDPLSKSLTSGQMRSMKPMKDRLGKGAWDPVGYDLIPF